MSGHGNHAEEAVTAAVVAALTAAGVRILDVDLRDSAVIFVPDKGEDPVRLSLESLRSPRPYGRGFIEGRDLSGVNPYMGSAELSRSGMAGGGGYGGGKITVNVDQVVWGGQSYPGAAGGGAEYPRQAWVDYSANPGRAGSGTYVTIPEAGEDSQRAQTEPLSRERGVTWEAISAEQAAAALGIPLEQIRDAVAKAEAFLDTSGVPVGGSGEPLPDNPVAPPSRWLYFGAKGAEDSEGAYEGTSLRRAIAASDEGERTGAEVGAASVA